MIKNKSSDLDWEGLPDSIRSIRSRGIFMDIIGPEGSGKSSLALTLARLGKVAYVDIDQSVDRAKKPDSKKHRENIRVLPVRYQIGLGMDEASIKNACAPVWAGMCRKVDEAAGAWARGAVIDTGTESWELNRLASYGTLNPKGKRMDRVYGPINARQRQLFRGVYRTHSRHLITIHQTKDEYLDKMSNDGEMKSIRTGKQVRAGFKEIGYLSDVVVRCFKEGGEFKAAIDLCKLPPNGPDLEGTPIEGDILDFAEIVALATGTDADSWRA